MMVEVTKCLLKPDYNLDDFFIIQGLSQPFDRFRIIDIGYFKILIPKIKTKIKSTAAIIGLSVLGLIDDKIVFRGSPCSSQAHSSSAFIPSDVFFMAKLQLHLGQIALYCSLSFGVSNINTWLHFGHVVLPFITFSPWR